MKRRHFLTSAAATTITLATGHALQAAAAPPARKQLIELRTYHFDSIDQQSAFDRFLRSTAVPALNAAGIRPVGVFTVGKSDNPELPEAYSQPLLFVLLPHPNPASVANLVATLASNPEFTAAGSATLQAPKSAPAYNRFESSLFLGFDAAPRVEVVAQGADRLLQLRIYESHSDERALRKIHMFNQGGEIDIFRRCGMPPVFFGQALIGSRLPNLTYLLEFENEDAQKKAWDAFREDPAWLALRNDPSYSDTVSRITNLILRPTGSSQI